MAIVTAHVAAVQELYVAYFNRPADVAGLDYWTNIVASQGSTAAVSATFATSPEYVEAFEGMDSEEIVDTIYQNLFGRAAEAGGKKYWADLLTAGTIKVDTIVAEVANAALTTDAEAVENKVAAATAFTNALDTPAEQAGYAGEDALALAKEFITGVTTDASLAAAIAPAALAASVAGVVAAGTPFTLPGALANMLAAQEAKADVLADLAENEAVAAQLDANGDDDVEAAIEDVVAATEGDIDAILPGFSTASAAMKAALIADEEDDLATAMEAAEGTLADAEDAVAEVEGLAEAIAAAEEASAAQDDAETAAGLALNAQNAALANLDTLNTGAVVLTAGTSVTVNAVVKIEFDATAEEYELAAGVTEANTPGVTEALEALNANLAAEAALTAANTAETNALTAADILDASDDGTLLGDVADAFEFTDLDTDELPTYDQILAEQSIFADRIDALDAVAGGAGQYEADLATLAGAVAGAADATAADVLLDAAVADGYITAADAAVILAAYNVAPAGVTTALVEENSWLGRSDALDAAVTALLAAETAEADIGNLADDLAAAETAVGGIADDVEALAEAVAAYEEAQALADSVAAADAAIAAAAKVITEEGFATPIVVENAITVATAKDDIFLAGSADVQIRSMGVLGQDTLYVGTTLKYNDTVIGSGTGETDLDEAGDNAVLEFFLNDIGTGVEVILENKSFGSESGGAADLTVITLVGVDLEDITVANGFITVGTPAA
ncbi:DUF4214 domain-containing protein [Massilia sp. DD77]|uniref:DUF4214 domain-containing protein n=1 Tax=Massilia sp. DD77 TaxID=3109349 RepID=UPI002FFF3DB7